MNKELVPYEQALLLKELGLEVKSAYWYNPNGVLLMKSFECDDETISVNVKNIIEYWDGVIKDRIDVPTYSQAFRWFRKNYDLHSNVGLYNFHENTYCFNVVTKTIPHYLDKVTHFHSHEEAELECLKILIEIVKNK